MSQTYIPDDFDAPDNFVAEHSGDRPPHHHHRHEHHKHEHHKHEHHKHEHRNDSPYTVNQGDTHNHGDMYPRTIVNNAAPEPLEGCLRLLRGIGSTAKCEAVLGHLIAALYHSGHIRGLVEPVTLAATHVNHYTAEIPSRDY